MLGGERITIHWASDGQTGLDRAASLRPDLILLDVEMPGADGFEICRKLRADSSTASIPIIFLTARATVEEMVRGLELGAIDYVIKPFRPMELLSRVRAAMRTSHLIRLLEEKALIDPLTGLGNRAMFNDRLAAELSLRIRSRDPLSCILLDVDRFKAVNDTYGHPFGDHVLKMVGEALMDICRLEDIACRYGGEEFVVLTPRTSVGHAGLLAERMRVAIAKIPFAHPGGSVAVTCSFGVAEADGLYDRLMVDRADQALYQSKEHGRNRVSVASSEPTSWANAA